MRKILFLLIAFTIAVSASADVDSTRVKQHATRQDARQAFIERVQQHAQDQQAQPQHQPQRERQAKPESNAQAKPEFKIPHKKAAEQPKAVIPAKHQGTAKPQPVKPLNRPQASAPAKEPVGDKNNAIKAIVNKKAPNRTPQVISNRPAGRMVIYNHAVSYYDFFFYYGYFFQDESYTYIIYDPDGETVYLQKIFFRDNDDSWVRGTINGNTITVPLGQYISYDSSTNSGFYLAWGTTTLNEDNEFTFVEDPNVTEFTLTIDGDNLIMDNTNVGNNGDGATGLAEIADENSEINYLQCSSVLSDPINSLNPVGYTAITSRPPGQQVVYDQALSIYGSNSNESLKTNIVFDPDGETVYFNNFYYEGTNFDMSNSWVKGTIVGNKIHVPLPQFTKIIGYDSMNALVWGRTVDNGNGSYIRTWDVDVTEMTFTIDRKGVLTLDNASPGVNGEGAAGFMMYNNSYYGSLQCASVLTPPYQAPELINYITEGEPVYYNRTSGGLINTENGLELYSGNDKPNIFYAPDGVTVYLQDPVAACPQYTWVKGTISGNTITVPLYQYIYYNQRDSVGGYLAWGTSVKNPDGTYSITPDYSVDQFTYTIDGDNITLDNSNGGVEGDGAVGLVVVHDDGDVPIAMEWNSEFTYLETPEVIFNQPDGELVEYDRMCGSLYYYYADDEDMYFDAWSGLMRSNIVYAPDGETVYIQNPVAADDIDSWVRGTINGNKITVPLGQCLYYDVDEGFGEYLAWGTHTKNPDGTCTFTQDPNVAEVTFTIDGDRLIMDNTSGNVDGATGLAAVIEEEVGFVYYSMEYNSVYTRFEVPTIIYDQPQGQLKTYDRFGSIVELYYGPESFSTKVNIVFAPDGETVYIQDLVAGACGGSWMRGTIANGKIHVPLGQYAFYDEEYGYGMKFVWGTTNRPPEGYYYAFGFTPDFNATEVTYTIDGDRIVMDNSSAGDNGDGATGLALIWDNGSIDFTMECNSLFLAPINPEFIEYQPDGLLSLYQKSGKWINYNGEEKQQAGVVPIIVAGDGETVYMYNWGWLKGTINDNKLSFPTRQCIYYNYNSNYGVLMAWGTYRWDENYQRYIFEYDPMVTEVTFTMDGDRIIMDNSTESADGLVRTGMAIIYSSNYREIDSFEWNSVLTYFEEPKVITEQPEGEVVYYDQEIQGTYLYDQGPISGTYTTEMVYAPNGNTVYILDPIPYLNEGTWVKGTIDEGKIHVPLGQYLYYDEEDYWGEFLAFGTAVMNDNGHLVFVQDPDLTEVTYTIHENGTISLDNTSAGDGSHNGATGLCGMYNDGDDANRMIWTSQYTSVTLPTVIDKMPEGDLVVYNRSGRAVNQLGNVVNMGTSLKMVYAPDGETVYIQNVAYGRRDDTWVMGTINNGKIHVPLGQYIWLNPSAKSGCYIAAGWGAKVDGNMTFTPATGITEMTYTINNDGTISIDNTYGGPNDDGVDGLGLCIVDTYGRCYGMEWNTVLTRSNAPVVITDQPEGIYKKYFRSTLNRDYASSIDYHHDHGVVEMVYSRTGNTVYIKNLISRTGYGTWVKGTIDGNKIHVPTGQYLTYEPNYDDCARLYWIKEVPHYEWIDGVRVQTGTDYLPDYDRTEVTYTINGDNITMDDHYPSDDNLGIGSYAFNLNGDNLGYNSWDYTAKFMPYFDPIVLDERPSGSLVTYNRRGNAIDHMMELRETDHVYPCYAPYTLDRQGGKAYVVYAPDGRTVYLYEPVQCLSNRHEPRYSWVAGTLSEDGHKIIVPLDQYVSWSPVTKVAERLAWGTTYHREVGDGDYEIYFVPDNSVMTVTYTIKDNCISMDNSSGLYAEPRDFVYWSEPDWADGNTGLAITDQFMEWGGELNWSTTYAGDHPAVPMDPVIVEWYDSGNEDGGSALAFNIEATDVDGYGLEETGYSYTIYTDKGKVYTFEASDYGLEEDVTEVTFVNWQDNYKLRPGCIYFYRTNAEGYEPFFNWRIGIQLHYTCDGIKQSSNIVYLEVFDEPVGPENPGDVTGDGIINVADVTSLIDYLLGSSTGSFNEANADVNGNGIVNVEDVTALIDLLLSNS